MKGFGGGVDNITSKGLLNKLETAYLRLNETVDAVDTARLIGLLDCDNSRPTRKRAENERFVRAMSKYRLTSCG